MQRTKDGHLVLIHDESLKCTAGSPLDVRDITLEELNSWMRAPGLMRNSKAAGAAAGAGTILGYGD
nr:glycerophosphodiester phosphodiesterase family protein [Paenibacillus farraposensis]